MIPVGAMVTHPVIHVLHYHRARARAMPVGGPGPGASSSSADAASLSNAQISPRVNLARYSPGRFSASDCAHYLDRGCSITVQGNLVQVKPVIHPGYEIGSSARGDRSHIISFSSSSRRRLIYRCASIDQFGTYFFITLTYARTYSKRFVTWKRHLDTFRKRLERRFGRVGVIWRLEPQGRGAPHFHLVVRTDNSRLASRVMGDRFKRFRQWVALNWTMVADRSGRARKISDCKYLRTQVQVAYSAVGVTAYVSKYAAKSSIDCFFHPRTGQVIRSGRYWGIWRRGLIMAVRRRVSLDVLSSVRFLRLMRTYLRRYRKSRFINSLRKRSVLSLRSIHLIDHWFAKIFGKIEEFLLTFSDNDDTNIYLYN